MNDHANITSSGNNVLQPLEKEFLEKISPSFGQLSLDIQEVLKFSQNPMFVSVLLFKLVEERQKTNQLIDQLNEKYDRLMLELKTNYGASKDSLFAEKKRELLPEQDQLILRLVSERGSATAEEIQNALSYKGTNAASQRLNKLVKEQMLVKTQAGRRVVFFVK